MLINNFRYVAEIAQSLAAIGVLDDRIALLCPHSVRSGVWGLPPLRGRRPDPLYQWTVGTDLELIEFAG
jgi:hypothetical protein